MLAVHRGTALGALTEVACSDDIDRPGGNYRSRAEFAVTAGQTYYVQVGGFRRDDGTIGAGSLTFTLSGAAQTASNNAFASATAVTALPFSVTAFDTRAATFQAGEPVPSCTDGVGADRLVPVRAGGRRHAVRRYHRERLRHRAGRLSRRRAGRADPGRMQ